MASTSETGHAKNLANIDKMYDLISQLGTTYNPTNPLLQLTGITTLKSNCQTTYTDHLTKFTTYKSATNNREIAFQPISSLATKISDSVKSLSVPQQTIDDVSAIVSKIHGSTSKLPKPSTQKIIDPSGTPPIDTTPPPTTISTSQHSFDSILANLDKLIQQIQNIPTYTPNETNIQIPTIQAQYLNLSNLNLAAITATNALNLARNQRNLVFYADNTGLCDIMKKVKIYIRQLYGSTSPQYHQATAIEFKKIVSKKKAPKK